ncbi:hypothetical protein NX059_002302 [Plenodomus lindquistii]|nr:hypothetical protein NX059_002302 [Plenodomus lindquistii]
MEHPDHITTWLRTLTIDSDDDKINARQQELGNLGEESVPVTPPRRKCVSAIQSVQDEASPISTIFSDRSIFDTPTWKTQQLRDDLTDDLSEITSVDNDEPDIHGKEDIHVTLFKPQQDQLPTPPASENSYDPPSSAASALPNGHFDASSARDIKAQDPSIPRAVNITSCLQCTHSHLPCSRTPPSCTRCVRNGKPDLCLLTRRLFPEEMVQSEHHDEVGHVVLLKIMGEDEELWRRKINVREKLMREWQEKQDRRNWVLPSWGAEQRGRKEGEQGRGMGRRGWEGNGRVTYRELCVDLDGES